MTFNQSISSAYHLSFLCHFKFMLSETKLIISLPRPFSFYLSDLGSQSWSLFYFFHFSFPYHSSSTNFVFSFLNVSQFIFFFTSMATILVRSLLLHIHNWNCCLISTLILSLPFQVYFIGFHQADLPNHNFHYVTPYPLCIKIQILLLKILSPWADTFFIGCQ